MNIAVTTPAGRVGRQVARRLADDSADLVLLARRPNALDPDLRQSADIRQGEL